MSFARPIVLELDGREVPSSAAELEVDVSSLDQYELQLIDNPNYVEFLRRYQHPLESLEFVPPEPLSPGEHEVVFRVLGYAAESDSYETRASYRFSVRAEEQPRPTSEVTISAVTGYTRQPTTSFDNGSPRGSYHFPPPEALDGVCESTATVNTDNCYGGSYWSGPPRVDLIDSGSATRVEIPPEKPFATRVDIAASGPALGYLIDSQFVLERCSAVMDSGIALARDEQPGTLPAVAFYVQAVLPTGLGPPRAFTGDVPIVEVPRTYDVLDYPRTTTCVCSLGAAGARTSGSDLATLALFVAGATVFRRKV